MNDITFYEFSSVAALTALLLSKKNIHSRFFLKNQISRFDNFPPISNPLVNNKIQLLERDFLDKKSLEKVCYIKRYDYRWYNSNKILTRHLYGEYNFPIYAIDNRIRYKCFDFCLRNNNNITIIDEAETEDVIKNNHGINIIGGGAKNSSLFESSNFYTSDDFKITKKLFYFNLRCDLSVLNQFSDGIALILDEFGYCFLYPSLHINGDNILTLVVCSHVLDNDLVVDNIALDKIIAFIKEYDQDIATGLKECELIKEDYFSIDLKPFFKDMINSNKQIGIGNAILRTDPITAKGYNSGMDIALVLINEIEKYSVHKDENLFYHSLSEQSNKILKQLFYLNAAFNQGKYYDSIHIVFKAAENDKDLKKHIIADTFEDIDNYFPWIYSKEDGLNLISKMNNISLK